MKTLSYLFFVLCAVGVSTAGEIIVSPPITNWGTWGAFDHCPNGTFARGFQLKTEPYKGALIDDTAGNAVRLFCGDPFDESTHKITSTEGDFGVWGVVYSCPTGSFINGFALRVEQNAVDETATNNFRFLCNTLPDPIEGDGLAFGLWRDSRRCSTTEALCALQTQVQPSQGALIDDTSLNNIAAECCDLPSPTTQPPTTTEATTQPPTTTEATTQPTTTTDATTQPSTTTEATTQPPTTTEATTQPPTTTEATTQPTTTTEATTQPPTTTEATTQPPTTTEVRVTTQPSTTTEATTQPPTTTTPPTTSTTTEISTTPITTNATTPTTNASTPTMETEPTIATTSNETSSTQTIPHFL